MLVLDHGDVVLHALLQLRVAPLLLPEALLRGLEVLLRGRQALLEALHARAQLLLLGDGRPLLLPALGALAALVDGEAEALALELQGQELLLL